MCIYIYICIYVYIYIYICTYIHGCCLDLACHRGERGVIEFESSSLDTLPEGRLFNPGGLRPTGPASDRDVHRCRSAGIRSRGLGSVPSLQEGRVERMGHRVIAWACHTDARAHVLPYVREDTSLLYLRANEHALRPKCLACPGLRLCLSSHSKGFLDIVWDFLL